MRPCKRRSSRSCTIRRSRSRCAREELPERVLLTRANAAQQGFIGVGVAGHVDSPNMITAQRLSIVNRSTARIRDYSLNTTGCRPAKNEDLRLSRSLTSSARLRLDESLPAGCR